MWGDVVKGARGVGMMLLLKGACLDCLHGALKSFPLLRSALVLFLTPRAHAPDLHSQHRAPKEHGGSHRGEPSPVDGGGLE